ncbi:hypothetical protein SAMN02745121_08821 [Nannocystis exedens]|uniref:Uncharacterized protein n=1 Tax=Nannocystis exedens TaxID=54 RepID=A0A1I2IN92_9BACT|nr:hypothetical protein [Nannocystis exedens]PCC74964.1 hypothetical protein NAEX_08064 [Nannocystis exedens]SFF43078.1 hypothetical protein SAMN02745121_08821 [Nannocystis exedens]
MTPQPFPVVREFVRDRDPAFFGRYRLWFQQVAPWFDDYRALIPVRPGATAELDAAIAALPDQHWPLHRIDRDRHARGWSLDRGEPGQDLLSLEQLSDVCYIDARNLHWALDRLAVFLADARLFVRSTGDADDRWLDEYTLAEGCAEVRRWHLPEPGWPGVFAVYEALVRERPADRELRRFVAYAHRERAAPLDPADRLAREHLARAAELEEA